MTAREDAAVFSLPETASAEAWRTEPAWPPAPSGDYVIVTDDYMAALMGPEESGEPASPHAICDALAASMPGFGIWPCGYCGAEFRDDGALGHTRALEYLGMLASAAGWRWDIDWFWTCPDCQADPAWQAKQGPVEVSGGTHAAGVLAISVALASNRYTDIDALFDQAEARAKASFDRIVRQMRGTPSGRHRAPQRRAA